MRDADVDQVSWLRRIGALVVDWFVCTLAVIAVLGLDRYSEDRLAGFYVLGLYVVETTLFTWLLAGSFGKLATGLRVVPADGVLRHFNPLMLLARQVLVALVIPPLVFRPDGRGLHDLAAGTATVTKDEFLELVARAEQR